MKFITDLIFGKDSPEPVAVLEKPAPVKKVAKKKAVKKSPKIKARSNEKYDDTDIGMLHNQFYGSSEALLVESQSFLKQRSKELKSWEKKEIANKKKVNDLKQYGFGNTQQARSFDDEVKEREEEIKCARRDIEEKTEVAEAVIHFSRKYPAYKFITYNGINMIFPKFWEKPFQRM